MPAPERIKNLVVGTLSTDSLTVGGKPITGDRPAPSAAPAPSGDLRVVGGTAIVRDSAQIATGLDQVVAAVATPGVAAPDGTTLAVAWRGSNIEVRVRGAGAGVSVVVSWLAKGV